MMIANWFSLIFMIMVACSSATESLHKGSNHKNRLLANADSLLEIKSLKIYSDLRSDTTNLKLPLKTLRDSINHLFEITQSDSVDFKVLDTISSTHPIKFALKDDFKFESSGSIVKASKTDVPYVFYFSPFKNNFSVLVLNTKENFVSYSGIYFVKSKRMIVFHSSDPHGKGLMDNIDGLSIGLYVNLKDKSFLHLQYFIENTISAVYYVDYSSAEWKVYLKCINPLNVTDNGFSRTPTLNVMFQGISEFEKVRLVRKSDYDSYIKSALSFFR